MKSRCGHSCWCNSVDSACSWRHGANMRILPTWRGRKRRHAKKTQEDGDANTPFQRGMMCVRIRTLETLQHNTTHWETRRKCHCHTLHRFSLSADTWPVGHGLKNSSCSYRRWVEAGRWGQAADTSFIELIHGRTTNQPEGGRPSSQVVLNPTCLVTSPTTWLSIGHAHQVKK